MRIVYYSEDKKVLRDIDKILKVIENENKKVYKIFHDEYVMYDYKQKKNIDDIFDKLKSDLNNEFGLNDSEISKITNNIQI